MLKVVMMYLLHIAKEFWEGFGGLFSDHSKCDENLNYY